MGLAVGAVAIFPCAAGLCSFLLLSAWQDYSSVKRKKISVARSSPRHTREPTRSLGLARRGQLILLDVLRIASWILGTSVPLKKGPSARGLQTVPHSKTGTRALLGPCAPAFRRCALRRRRRSRRRCCYTLSAACTRSALVRS